MKNHKQRTEQRANASWNRYVNERHIVNRFIAQSLIHSPLNEIQKYQMSSSGPTTGCMTSDVEVILSGSDL